MTEDANKADAALDKAASDAVEGQETEVEEETTAFEPVETEAEADSEGLPIDQGERSNLGRKIAAMHRRQDQFDQKFDQVIDLLKSQANQNQNVIEEEDGESLITLKQAREMARGVASEVYAENEASGIKSKQEYDDAYLGKFAELTSDMSKQEYGELTQVMQKMTYSPSGNGAVDAELNFYKARAELAVQGKLPNKQQNKVNPLKGEEPVSELGTVTNQKQVGKQDSMPELDRFAKSYLGYVTKEDGDEKATALRKSIK